MGSRKRSMKLQITVAAFVAVMVVVGVMGCAPKANEGNPTPVGKAPTVVPVDQKNKFGLIGTEAWKDQYPDQYTSYFENEKNEWPEEDGNRNARCPEMVTLGKGYGYAKFFYDAGGHTSAMYTVTHNGRVGEKTKAQCLACKTPDIHEMVAQQGESAWKSNFFEVAEQCEDGITCAMCHENENPSALRIERADWKRALGDNADKRHLSSEVCGQCHCDYSMNATTGEPTSPYDDVTTMTPENALKWYDEHGYVDWTYPETGAKMIAVRHSEFEYTNGGMGNHMVQLGYDCADCHMAVKTNADGEAYHSHYWTSPLQNEDLIKNDCSKCHADLKSEMKAIMEKYDDAIHQNGMRNASFVQNFVKAVQAGTLTDEQLERLRTIQRESTFYWNSAYAENSNGCHNPALFDEVLAKSEALLDEGDQILGEESSPDKFVSEYDPSKDYQFEETSEEYYAKHDQR